MINKLFILFFIIATLASCSGGKGVSGSKKNIKKEAAALADSVDYAWKTMIESDDRKISSIKRLLDEVSYTKDYNQEELAKAKSLQENLKKKRYSPEAMTSSQIDAYDMATDSAIKATYALVSSTPEMEKHSITESLKSEIEKEDGQVIYYRIRYDRNAKKYNSFVEGNNVKLQKLGKPYSDYKKRPLFELTN